MPGRGPLRASNKQALNTKSWGYHVLNQHKKITRGPCPTYRNARVSVPSSIRPRPRAAVLVLTLKGLETPDVQPGVG